MNVKGKGATLACAREDVGGEADHKQSGSDDDGQRVNYDERTDRKGGKAYHFPPA